MIHDKLHSLHHQLLRRISQMQGRQILPPLVNLFSQIDLHRTNIRAGITKRTSRHVPRILLRRLQHTQVNPHGTRYKIRVRISPRPTIHGTSVNTWPATNTLQHIHVFRTGQNITSPVIHDHDMHLLPFYRFLIMGRVGRWRLSRGRAGQQAHVQG